VLKEGEGGAGEREDEGLEGGLKAGDCVFTKGG